MVLLRLNGRLSREVELAALSQGPGDVRLEAGNAALRQDPFDSRQVTLPRFVPSNPSDCHMKINLAHCLSRQEWSWDF